MKMDLIAVDPLQRGEATIQSLETLWERSVRATHTFLKEADIAELRDLVPEYLRSIPYLAISMSNGTVAGFLGIDGDKLEMLFIDPDFRGCGIGRTMMRHAAERGVLFVAVNEQNEQAVGFYLHLGCSVISRSEVDSQGNPFPLLHLRLPSCA